MPLTDHETAFLAAFIHEATSEPFFTGPATRDLHARGIYYTDLYSLMTAYCRLHPGTPECLFGAHNPSPPPCPWPDREAALQREEEIRQDISLTTGPHPDASPLESDRDDRQGGSLG